MGFCTYWDAFQRLVMMFHEVTNIDPISINGLTILLSGIELHYSRC